MLPARLRIRDLLLAYEIDRLPVPMKNDWRIRLTLYSSHIRAEQRKQAVQGCIFRKGPGSPWGRSPEKAGPSVRRAQLNYLSC
jgi:hypothetical protein